MVKLKYLDSNMVALSSMLDSMTAWHASSPFLGRSRCAPGSPFLLSRYCVGMSVAAAAHLHSSAYLSCRLLHRSRTEAPLSPCRGQSAARQPFSQHFALPETQYWKYLISIYV